jgi:type IV pilus assembly protein PilM
MAEKVISIKIGNSVTQVAEVDYGAKNPKIHHAFSFETPEGTIDDSGVRISDMLIGLIRNGMAGSGMKSEKVIFTLSSARVASREVTIPMVKEKKIKTILIANSKDYFPVDLSEFQLVYRIIEKKKAEKQIKLLVFAVPNSLVQSYVALAQELEMQLVAVDYLGNSIYQAMIRSLPTDVAATICIDDNTSTITVIRDGQIALQRTIGYGIDEAVHPLTMGPFARNGMQYLDALDMLRRSQFIGDTLRAERNDSMNVRREITHALTMLVGNISRVLDYYFSRNTDVELSRITLIGLGADCLGLDRLLSNELDVYVEAVRKFGQADIGRGLERQGFHLGEYYASLGSALKPLTFSFETMKDKKNVTSLRLPTMVFVGCLAISAVLLGTQILANLMLEADNTSMEQQITSKQSAIDTYNDYVTKKMINQEMRTVDENTKAPNDLFLEFLEEMETCVPKDLIVANISTIEDQVSMTLTTSSMVSAADTLVQIRNFRTVSVMSCSGLTEVEDDNGVTSVEFSVVLTYNTTLLDEGDGTEDALTDGTEGFTEGGDGSVGSTQTVEGSSQTDNSAQTDSSAQTEGSSQTDSGSQTDGSSSQAAQ